MQNLNNYLEAIQAVLQMAESHVDDVESGVEDGIYDAAENEDIDDKRASLELVAEYLQNFAHLHRVGMTTELNGQFIPVAICYGLVHQIVREYDGDEVDGKKTLGGTTTVNPKSYFRYPSFTDFGDAVKYLEDAPFAGFIQSYVAEADGKAPSWITAGVYYRKAKGIRSLNG